MFYLLYFYRLLKRSFVLVQIYDMYSPSKSSKSSKKWVTFALYMNQQQNKSQAKTAFKVFFYAHELVNMLCFLQDFKLGNYRRTLKAVSSTQACFLLNRFFCSEGHKLLNTDLCWRLAVNKLLVHLNSYKPLTLLTKS